MDMFNFSVPRILSYPQLNGGTTSESKWGELIRTAKANDDALQKGFITLASLLPITKTGVLVIPASSTAKVDLGLTSSGFFLVTSNTSPTYSAIISYVADGLSGVTSVWHGSNVVFTSTGAPNKLAIYPTPSNSISFLNNGPEMTISYTFIK